MTDTIFARLPDIADSYFMRMPDVADTLNIRVPATAAETCPANNHVPFPNDFSTWDIINNASVNTDVEVSPGQNNDADRLNLGPAATDWIQLLLSVPPNTFQSVAFWFKPITTSGQLLVENPYSPGLGRWFVNLSLLAPGWQLVNPAHPAVNETSPFRSDGAGNTGIILAPNGGYSVQIFAWCAYVWSE